ncbi:phosphate propanoyltransferase [Irregularibacter muris]|uniref:Phosphate propanoyltransferase n=1 Tax=Irregularibacter muris TaxID=1796619 RepID=A0AAE3HFY1_9FIRM|nr:phosphate propanoyltransferase [Irregularibacter muris]MCR1898393.1 phosphate propanoyltransferase [Irregularibacter muris]
MNRQDLRKIVEEVVKNYIEDILLVPVGVSNRHIHLKQEDLETLFGKGYQLTRYKDLKQPGEFAAQETLEVKTQKGSLKRVRILGPIRNHTQVELSLTDGYTLGINPPIRESGNIQHSSSVTLVGPKGEVILPKGAIAAYRHIHMPEDIAQKHGLTNGQIVQVETTGPRALIFKDVMLRVSDKYALEMHIDVDEANAANLKNGDRVRIREILPPIQKTK